ncbi:AAA+-type ATPase [Aspergillus brasiliensis]|uniref:AAA+-type ATPase n=1 Tax=Aspergillus brasiliensis TaxID=319629 RepID=A0A9W6DSB4_9EURO|nr:AAA+-type ATPase [Aspergillus brasiliensis]
MGEDLRKPLERGTHNIQVRPTGLGGMNRQIEIINESLADFNPGRLNIVMPSFYEHSRGILLYGPKGTGKTALLEQIKTAGWRQTFHIGSSAFGRSIGDAESKLRNIFQEAMRCQPSAILIDQVEFIAPRRTSLDSQSLASVLCECVDATKNAFVLIVAATRHPNDVDDALRTPHRLATEIELHIPTAQDRAQILRAICGCPSPSLSDTLIDMIAEKTHGYVGADLFALLQLISRKARQRQTLESVPCFRDERIPTDNAVGGQSTQEPGTPIHIIDVDVLSALQETRPTAMREVFLETPKVRWSDIGGQHEIKRRLQKAVERPLKHPERMRRLNLNSKKGVLLYGPPGCSKTLTVKALATEAGLNFLAVKGAEILSMYVGESERALREIFRKARSARPSIIFFDEIDAIASRRGSSSQGGVNVLTTLLNEMDGIEELKSVLVIAATNKPEVIDPALMRPGRLDNILYIGPPDYEARKEILDIWFRKSVINPEVEVDVLALKTEGYSGAEIVSICETAGDAALDEEEETGQAQDIRWEHFEYALKQVKRQITAAVVEAYEQWGDSVDI